MNPMEIKMMTKQKMIDNGIKTAEYQIELLREHLLCKRQNNSVVEIHFDSKLKQYYVKCSDCAIYFKEEI